MVGLVVGVYAVGWALASTVGVPSWYWYPVPLLLVLYSRCVRLRGIMVLETDKSPATVREEFAGSDPPTGALARAFADDVSQDETGVKYTAEGRFRSSSVAHETTRSDDAIVTEVTKDEAPWSTSEVSVESTPDATRVEVSFEADRRYNLLNLLIAKVREPFYYRALEVRGYQAVGDAASVTI